MGDNDANVSDEAPIEEAEDKVEQYMVDKENEHPEQLNDDYSNIS